MSLFSAAFLSVYSEKQGSKNLAFLLSSVPFLLLTALYFLCYGLLNLDAQVHLPPPNNNTAFVY
jgi:hypothetical protein